MKKVLSFHFFIILIIISCGRHELITPFAMPSDAPLAPYVIKGEYYIEPLDIVDTGPIGKIPIPIIGGLIKGIGNTMADIFVAISSGIKIKDIDEIEEIDLSSVDFDMIQEIKLTNLNIRIVKNSENKPKTIFGRFYNTILSKKAKLDFIDYIEIYATNKQSIVGKKVDNKILVASYYHDKNFISPTKKMIKFNLHNHKKLLMMLKKNPSLLLFPKVKIRKIPKRTFLVKKDLNYKLVLYSPFLEDDQRR